MCVRGGKGWNCGEHRDTNVLLNSAKTDAVPWAHLDTARHRTESPLPPPPREKTEDSRMFTGVRGWETSIS